MNKQAKKTHCIHRDISQNKLLRVMELVSSDSKVMSEKNSRDIGSSNSSALRPENRNVHRNWFSGLEWL